MKLDVSLPNAPIVYQAPQYLYSSGASTAISPNGERLVLSDGEVLRATELTEDGAVGKGVALFSDDGNQIISTIGPQIMVNRYDARTLDLIESIQTPCRLPNPSNSPFPISPIAIQVLPNNYGWVIIGGPTICLIHLADGLFQSGFEIPSH
ncbi:hypothetical protein ELE36_07030 [Pseudolysobacter antarcticus]|uniref:WD40 repeat domain-containing protein n=1 Tax=Pseudolysobacter antarcticus TaxID=2511995 RepID=A0A411HHZ5_9GAMM|nr:hypothetical protein [Pseudolysobacter antarcticus]QBB70138.1 hypothetical protein ELE36_07030 [Pseudolysobacter antarcticus]